MEFEGVLLKARRNSRNKEKFQNQEKVMRIFRWSWNFQGMKHKFVESPGVEACFLEGKVTNI